MAIRTRPEVWGLKDLHYLSKSKKIKLDLSFQSVMRWKLLEMLKYLRCTVDGFATSPIVLADIDACLQAAKSTKDQFTIEYFEKLKKEGYEYVIIDGNNRRSTIDWFFTDRVGIPTGNYENTASGSVFSLFRNSQKTINYSELDDQQKSYFNIFPVNMTIVEKISRPELSEYFDALNSGVKLNHQEIINSWYSSMAEQVREWSEKYYKLFDGLIKGAFKVKRRDHDEFIAHWAVSCQSEQFSTNITKTMVEDSYGNNSEYKTTVSMHPELWEPVLQKTLEVAEKFPGNVISKSTLLDVANFLRQHTDKSIHEHYFAEYMMEVIENLQESDDIIWWDEHTGNQFTYNGMLRDTWKSEYMRKRVERMNEIFFTLNPEKADNVLPVEEEWRFPHDDEFDPPGIQLDPQRFYTSMQRYKIWLKQDKKDINGIDIPLEELMDASKWQADHIIEWSQGGKTTVENGQLMSIIDHQAKTALANRKRLADKAAARQQALAEAV